MDEINKIHETLVMLQKQVYGFSEQLEEFDRHLNQTFQTANAVVDELSANNRYTTQDDIMQHLEIDEDELNLLVVRGKLRFITFKGLHFFREDDVKALFTFDRSLLKD